MATPADRASGSATAAAAVDARSATRRAMPLWPGADRPANPRPPDPPRPARPGDAGFNRSEPPDDHEHDHDHEHDLDWPEFEEVLAAWYELGSDVPAAEMRTALAADVAVLNRQPETPAAKDPASAADSPGVTDRAVPAAEPPVAAGLVSDAGATVGTALAGAEAHAHTLRDHPEWQRIQSVRGALGHVWDVMKEKAGPYWKNLRADVRFQGFWKTASIRACEAISTAASALVRRLQGDLPAADALLKLSDATLTYSTVAAAEPASTPQPARPAAGSAEPSMRRDAERKPPTAYATRDDSVRAAREVTKRFEKWISSPMGQELAGSDHRRVAEFRDAWQQLPPHESGPGQAVGPYGDVAERAKTLATAAVASTRFAPGDLRALQALAWAADQHAARLSVTLPPGTATPAPKAAALAPRVATPTTPTARTPRARAST